MYAIYKEIPKKITLQDILNAIEEMKDGAIPTGPKRFFTGGTGIPDQVAIDFWKDDYIVVVDRDGKEWLHGEPYEGG